MIRSAGLFSVAIVLIALSGRASGNEEGLLVRYDFEGNDNHASIHGAQRAPAGKGHCLQFDGEDDYVDCGQPDFLKLTDKITLEAWINPHSVPAGETGVIGRGSSYDGNWGLTYAENGRCYFYISKGANNCSAELTAGSWHHIAATFDGSTMRLYIDGKEAASKSLDQTPINNDGDVFIGKNGRFHFNGMIDDVRIYDRVLPPEAFRSRYETGLDDKIESQLSADLADPQTIRNDAFAIRVGRGGAMDIEVGKDRYRLRSAFSYPANKIGRNLLSEELTASEPDWRPVVTVSGDHEIMLAATGAHYTLNRDITLDDDKLHVQDTLRNITDEPVAIIVEYDLGGTGRLRDVLLAGGNVSSVESVAENPSVFISQPSSSLGIVAQDNLFRLQFQAAASNQQVKFVAKHFALKAGGQHTFKWTVYPFQERADYFDFVNAIRRDWNANYTIQGPFDWITVAQSDLLENPQKLKAHLNRRKLKIVGLLPYLSYFSGAPLSRDEYKALMQKASAALKRADPEILCLGSIENNIVSYDRAKLSKGGLLDDVCRGTGTYPLILSETQTRMLLSDLPWKDSLVLNQQGRAMIEDCNPISFVHPMVYSAPGNYHTQYLMDQAKFIIEEVGLDGVYMDHFNMTFEKQQRYDYSKWDDVTVDIDPDTGQITRKYTDAGLAGIKPREELARYILTNGKAFVVNTQNVANETQTVPIMHFEEVGSNANLDALNPGEEPPLIQYIAKLQLGSPIGLGLPSSNKANPGVQEISEVMKTLILYLRHGLLFYHNQTLVPETGPGSGEYGPINHMFPITPIELHKGWILGQERVITTVSGTFPWKNESEPRILCFDHEGRPTEARCTVSGSAGDRQIRIELKDWQEIGIIE